MILRRGQPLLLPVSPGFIWVTLGLAFLLNLLPLGRLAWMPDVLAVVLVFWSAHQPRHVGLCAAFIFGLCLDVHQAALLGQHALAYAALSFAAVSLQRRMLWQPVLGQALLLLPVFALAHGLTTVVRLMAGGVAPGWPALLAPLLEAALWPPLTWLLLAPQRRAPRPDADRPI
ncbi:MAG: rod shape-determining protein MreD [Ottowia sp.]